MHNSLVHVAILANLNSSYQVQQMTNDATACCNYFSSIINVMGKATKHKWYMSFLQHILNPIENWLSNLTYSINFIEKFYTHFLNTSIYKNTTLKYIDTTDHLKLRFIFSFDFTPMEGAHYLLQQHS